MALAPRRRAAADFIRARFSSGAEEFSDRSARTASNGAGRRSFVGAAAGNCVTAAVFHALAARAEPEVLRLVWARERSAGDVTPRQPRRASLRRRLRTPRSVLESAGLVARREEGGHRHQRDAARRLASSAGGSESDAGRGAFEASKAHAEAEEIRPRVAAELAPRRAARARAKGRSS